MLLQESCLMPCLQPWTVWEESRTVLRLISPDNKNFYHVVYNDSNINNETLKCVFVFWKHGWVISCQPTSFPPHPQETHTHTQSELITDNFVLSYINSFKIFNTKTLHIHVHCQKWTHKFKTEQSNQIFIFHSHNYNTYAWKEKYEQLELQMNGYLNAWHTYFTWCFQIVPHWT